MIRPSINPAAGVHAASSAAVIPRSDPGGVLLKGGRGRRQAGMERQSDGIQPGPAAAMTSITCRYEGELRCRAQHGPSGSLLDTDAPVDNQGKGENFSPTDLLATSLATCILTIMGIVAERHGWLLDGATARVEKSMASEGPRRVERLEVWVTLPAALDEQQRRQLQRAAEACPVKRSLAGAITMELHWDGG